jgi:hypothetical protein
MASLCKNIDIKPHYLNIKYMIIEMEHDPFDFLHIYPLTIILLLLDHRPLRFAMELTGQQIINTSGSILMGYISALTLG